VFSMRERAPRPSDPRWWQAVRERCQAHFRREIQRLQQLGIIDGHGRSTLPVFDASGRLIVENVPEEMRPGIEKLPEEMRPGRDRSA
jgi:hypothetical protein